MTHFVLLDLSYLIFHRYFAVKAWEKLTQPEGVTDYEAKILKGFETFLAKLKKHLKLADFSNVFFMKDTSRSLIWRTTLFPAYKQNRDQVASNQKFDPEVFTAIYQNAIPVLEEKYKIREFGMTTAEADDCIAVAVDVIEAKFPDAQITIMTNDNDFVQLIPGRKERLNIYNASFVDIVSRFDDTMMSVYTEWKVIKGDKSDNIPSIGPKIGDKTALKLALSSEALAKKLAIPAVKEQYMLNKQLIDFAMIPAKLRDDIKSAFFQMLSAAGRASPCGAPL